MELQGPERFWNNISGWSPPFPHLEIGVGMENRAPLLTTRHQPGLFEMKTKNSSLKENVFSKVLWILLTSKSTKGHVKAQFTAWSCGGCSGNPGEAAVRVKYHQPPSPCVSPWQILHSINKTLVSAKPLGKKDLGLPRKQITWLLKIYFASLHLSFLSCKIKLSQNIF